MYSLGGEVGRGSSSVVLLATARASGRQFAAKVICLPPEGDAGTQGVGAARRQVMQELQLMRRLGGHPAILRLEEHWEEAGKVYVLLELMRGGELLDVVAAAGRLREEQAAAALTALLRGVQHMHAMGVVHRDLKLENLLLAVEEDLGSVKIGDFGLAATLDPSGRCTTRCGTPMYVAPEVLAEPCVYGVEADMWSLGVVLYIMLVGHVPFAVPPSADANTGGDAGCTGREGGDAVDEALHAGDEALYACIRSGAFNTDSAAWCALSDSAKDLVRRLLVLDPARRLSADQALAHPWLAAAAGPHPRRCSALPPSRAKLALAAAAAAAAAAAEAEAAAAAAGGAHTTQLSVVGQAGACTSPRALHAAAAASGGDATMAATTASTATGWKAAAPADATAGCAVAAGCGRLPQPISIHILVDATTGSPFHSPTAAGTVLSPLAGQTGAGGGGGGSCKASLLPPQDCGTHSRGGSSCDW